MKDAQVVGSNGSPNKVKIEAAENGFILEYDDPAIMAENRKSDSGWKDPEVSRVYATANALISDLKMLLPGMKKEDVPQADEYKSAFKEATKSE